MIPRKWVDSARDVHLDGNAAGPCVAAFASPRAATVEAKALDAEENLVAMGTGTCRIFEGSETPIV